MCMDGWMDGFVWCILGVYIQCNTYWTALPRYGYDSCELSNTNQFCEKVRPPNWGGQWCDRDRDDN